MNEAVSQHFSHLCYGNFFWPRWIARLSIMSEPSYLRGEHWGLSPHLPAPVTAKHSRNPASAIPVTGLFPSLLVLRLFPSLFSYRLFLMVWWKNESKLTRKVLLTFRWISVASILVEKKTSVPSPLSFPWSITTSILVSDLERGWFALSYKLCLTRIFCINFNCQATKRNGYKMTT